MWPPETSRSATPNWACKVVRFLGGKVAEAFGLGGGELVQPGHQLHLGQSGFGVSVCRLFQEGLLVGCGCTGVVACLDRVNGGLVQWREGCGLRRLHPAAASPMLPVTPLAAATLRSSSTRSSDLRVIGRTLEERDGLALDHGNGRGNSLNLEGLGQLREGVDVGGGKHQAATVALNNPFGSVKDGG